MLFELIAAIVAGFAGAGIVMLTNKALGGRLPRWLAPAGAGLAMLAMTITNEYSWYPRTAQGLPDGLIVAETVEDRAVYRPWTYLVPFVSRFIAVDTASMLTNDAVADQRLVDVYLFARWTPPRKRSVVVDCAEGWRADVNESSTFGADGELVGVDWRDVGADDPIVRGTCDG